MSDKTKLTGRERKLLLSVDSDGNVRTTLKSETARGLRNRGLLKFTFAAGPYIWHDITDEGREALKES